MAIYSGNTTFGKITTPAEVCRLKPEAACLEKNLHSRCQQHLVVSMLL